MTNTWSRRSLFGTSSITSVNGVFTNVSTKAVSCCVSAILGYYQTAGRGHFFRASKGGGAVGSLLWVNTYSEIRQPVGILPIVFHTVLQPGEWFYFDGKGTHATDVQTGGTGSGSNLVLNEWSV